MAYTYGSVTNCKVRNGQTRTEYECRLGFQVNSQSIENNTSNVTLRLECRSISSSYTTKGSSGLTSIIDGTTVKSNASVDMSNTNTWQNFGERTITITHNADGTCSVSKSGSFTCTAGSSNYSLSSGSASVTVVPATIPRASQPTLSSGSTNIGSAVTIYMNRVSTSFTHYVYAQWASKRVEIGSNITDNVSWTLPMDFCNDIPSSPNGWGNIYVDTYSGGTYVGTKSVGFTGTVPSSVVPNIGTISLSEANSSVSSLGVLVQGKSSLNVNIDTSGSYGSWVTNCKVEGIDNTTYWSTSFTSGTLQLSGTRTVTVTITDSRGRTATKTTTYTCVAYSNPSISTATVTRCNSDGTANEEGIYVKYSFKASVASVSNKNTYSYKLGYKNSTSSSYTYITISNSAYTLDKSNVVISGVTFSVDNSYDFQFLVTDYFTSTSVIKDVGTGFTLMDFRYTGKGMAIGKVSEGDYFDVNMGSTFRKGLTSDNGIEIYFSTPFIDFHHNNSTADYTTRLIEQTAGTLTCDGNFSAHNFIGNLNGTVTCGNRNTGDTWIPVWNSGKLDYTYRKFYNNTPHTNHPNDQDCIPTMDFLSYWNGAFNSSGNSNLSRCSEGTIQAKPTLLYDNSSGSNGTITLSETSANFSCIEIYCKSNDDVHFAQKIYSPNGKNVTLNMVFTTESASAYLKNRLISISGTSISNYGTRYSESKLTSAVSTSTVNTIYITKVVGYK